MYQCQLCIRHADFNLEKVLFARVEAQKGDYLEYGWSTLCQKIGDKINDAGHALEPDDLILFSGRNASGLFATILRDSMPQGVNFVRAEKLPFDDLDFGVPENTRCSDEDTERVRKMFQYPFNDYLSWQSHICERLAIVEFRKSMQTPGALGEYLTNHLGVPLKEVIKARKVLLAHTGGLCHLFSTYIDRDTKVSIWPTGTCRILDVETQELSEIGDPVRID